MKKIALLLALVVGTAFSQSFEPAVGLGLSTPGGDGSDKIDGGLSYSVGAQYRLTLGGFGILPGVFYTSRSFSGEDGGATMEGSYSFINVPLLASFPVAPGFNLIGGPQLWSNLGGEAEMKFGGETMTSKSEKETGLGFSAVAGAEVTVLPMVNISARYEYQFSSLTTMDGDDSSLGEFGIFVSYEI